MVKFYVSRIKDGKMTLDQVPPKWYDKTESALKEEQKEDISIDHNDEVVDFIKSAKFTMTNSQKEKIIRELLVPNKCKQIQSL